MAEGVGPGAAPVLLLMAGSAGVAQRVQNSSVVLPNLGCAGLISVLVFLTQNSSLCFFCGSVLHQREGEELRVKKCFEVLIYLR